MTFPVAPLPDNRRLSEACITGGDERGAKLGFLRPRAFSTLFVSLAPNILRGTPQPRVPWGI